MKQQVELVVFDMAGTTIADDGLVTSAFERAARECGLADDDAGLATALAYVHATMGQSKIEVFRHLTAGDEELAQRGNAAFERAYADLVDGGACEPIPGAREVLGTLREAGVATALTTGFSSATQEAILAAVEWGGVVDVVLCPGEGIRGRPSPDMPLTALLRTGASAVSAMAVVGDTPSDARSGAAAGAGLVVGVRTGGVPDDDLLAAGAHVVLD